MSDDELLEYLENELGNSLRLVVRKQRDKANGNPSSDNPGHEILFSNDGDEEYTESTLNHLINEITMRELNDVFGETGREYLGELTPYGEFRASVEFLRTGVLMLISSQHQNYIILIDRDDGIEFFSLVNGLNEILM